MGLCCGLCDFCGNLSRIVILTLTIAGVVLQGYAAFYQCEFLNYDVDASGGGAGGGGGSGTFGFYGYKLPGEDDECTPYGTEEMDADRMLKAARSMVILALAAACAAGTLVLFEFLFCKVCCAGCLEGLGYVVATVCSALGYLAYASEFCNYTFGEDDNGNGTTMGISATSSCSFGKGATYNLLAMAAYFASSVVLACTPQPTPLFRK